MIKLKLAGFFLLKKRAQIFFFSVQCLFLSFFLSKADHFRTAVRNLRRRKQITFSTLRHADISSSSEKRKKGLLASQCASSQQIRTRVFCQNWGHFSQWKVRHPSISHTVKNHLMSSEESSLRNTIRILKSKGKSWIFIAWIQKEYFWNTCSWPWTRKMCIPYIWRRMRCGTTSLTPFGTTYVPVSYNLDPP